jgi:outer membrane protein assembly factor BamB
MKYNFYIFFIGIFLTISISCNKVEIDKEWDSPTDKDPIERKGDTLNAHWMVRHNHSDDGKNFSFKPVVINGLVIGSSKNFIDPEKIFGINVIEKEIIWEWNNYKGQALGERANLLISFKYQPNKLISSNLICVTNKAIYSIDALTGETKESYLVSNEQQSIRYGSVQNNALIQGIDLESGNSAILLCDEKLECRNLYSESVPSNHGIHFSNPRFDLETSPDDSLLYFGVEIRDKALSPKYPEIKFVSYNISKQKVDWEFHIPRNLDAKVFSQHKVNAPLIVGDRIYFQLQTHLFCLDIETGEELWRHNYANGVGVGQSIKLIHDKGRLYFADSRGDVTCLDANTGRRLWFNSNSEETGGAADDIVLYNNKLYMTDLVSLTVVDALSGKGIGKFKSPNAKHFSDAQINAITIDEENEIIYVDDGYYIMACEIPGQ